MSKASGPDSVGNKFIKILCDSVVEPLTVFFNYSLDHGVFPSKWKHANVTPIFKKGDMSTVTNYRPVSLLSCLSKVFEKAVSNRLISYIKENNLISANQSGFMPDDGTTNQIVKIVDYILQGFDSGKDTIAVFLDISKAFDRVWHKGLMVKLRNNGIKGNLLKWFQSYLTGRTQQVVINGCTSDPLPVTSGVPQGSVLGPILFLLFIDDLTDDLICNNNLFADDASLAERVNNLEESATRVNNDLRTIQMWADKWLVSFNHLKTVFVYFSLRNVGVVKPILIFCGTIIKEAPSHTHLGITLTNTLDWTEHINQILTKASKRLFFLKSLSRKLPRMTLLTLYNSMIRSTLEYGCVVFGELPAILSQKLERLQYRAGLAICGAINNSSYEKIRVELGWSTLEERRKFLQMTLMYKILNGLAPTYLQSIVIPNLPNLPYRLNLRNANNIYARRCRLGKVEKGFGISAVKNWNLLPVDLRGRPSVMAFKINYKKLYFLKPRVELNYGNRFLNIVSARFRLSFTLLHNDLANRGIIDSPICPKCFHEPETYSHYFLRCNNYIHQRRTMFLQLRALLSSVAISLDSMSNDEIICTLLFGNIDLNVRINESIFRIVQEFIRESARF